MKVKIIKSVKCPKKKGLFTKLDECKNCKFCKEITEDYVICSYGA